MDPQSGEAVGGVGSLPAELLSECLQAAEPPTRLSASHVSRTWRDLALSEPRLWDSFICLQFRNEQHEDAMFDKLREMLNRSCSLPFRLGIPHRSSCLTTFEYRLRMYSLIRPHVRRLALYDGPHGLFCHLSRDCVPLPALASLNIAQSAALWGSQAIMNFVGDFPTKNLPNLRRLRVPYVYFSADTAPLEGLEDLTLSIDPDFEYQRLFDLCPNLVHVHFDGIDASVVLPPISLPRSLRRLTISPMCEGIDMPGFVRNWAGENVPLIIFHDAHSLHGVLPLFLSSHSYRVELWLNDCAHELELKALPDDGTATRTWTITPSPSCDVFLSGLETRNCQRLTSISVAIEQLGRLFAAQLKTPGLEFLQFHLVGTQESPPIQADDDHFFIRAPRLQRVAFNLSGHVDAIREHMDDIRRTLDVLRGSFRALIVYDAELLESITVSIPAAVAMEIDCAAFAHFAKQYVILDTV